VRSCSSGLVHRPAEKEVPEMRRLHDQSGWNDTLGELAALKARSRELDASGGRAAAPDPVGEVFRLTGTLVRFDRDNEIYGEEGPAEYFYRLESGAVRAFKQLMNGRRQIEAFHLEGELFGLEAEEIHGFTVEAIIPTTVRIVKRQNLIAMARSDPTLAFELWLRTAEALRRAHEHILLLGRKTAEERVVSFLLDMATRGAGGAFVELPMIRRDIADYLGLAIETVSRTFTELENKAAIQLTSSRRINIGNRDHNADFDDRLPAGAIRRN
jgi:CRP/FNR family transcriptional regulator, nitrogen fixation regulation protein